MYHPVTRTATFLDITPRHLQQSMQALFCVIGRACIAKCGLELPPLLTAGVFGEGATTRADCDRCRRGGNSMCMLTLSFLLGLTFRFVATESFEDLGHI